MLEVAFVVAVTGVLFMFAGLPFATALRQDGEGWIAYLTDAAGYGVVFLTIAITGWTWFGIPALILAAILLAAVSVFAVRRHVGFPRLRGRAPLPRSLVIGWIVVVAIAIAFRLHDDTFLPWVGDMGAYVNWSNELVRTGALTASWPPVYSVFLSVAGGIFGHAGTTQGIAFTGFLFLAVVARMLTKMRVNRWIVLGIGGAMAFNIHAIWYSYFPSSESLNAPVFVIWLSLLVTMLKLDRRLVPVASIVTFLVALNLNLLRGSGSFLLAPLLVLAVLTLCLSSWRRWARRVWVFLFATLLAAEVGVWYGVSHIPTYFVDTQVRMLIPAKLFSIAQGAGLFSPGIVLFVVLVVMLAAAGVGMWGAVHLSAKPGDRGIGFTRVFALVAGILLGVAILAEGLVGANIWFIMLRMGMWLIAMTIVALVLVWRSKTLSEHIPLVFLAAATVMMLIAFHTPRLGNDRPHAFFIYWDRYLVSEVLPALIILSALGASFALPTIASWWSKRGRTIPGHPRLVAALPVLATAAVVVATALPSIPILRLEAQDSYMAGADTFTQKLMSYSTAKQPKLWGATSHDSAPGFFFPNTWMAFAIPMHRSYGYSWLNVSQGEYNFDPDHIITAAQLTKDVAAHGSVLVYETQTGSGEPLGERISSPGLTVTRVSEVTSNISLLAQRPQLAHWTHAHIRVIVWKVTA